MKKPIITLADDQTKVVKGQLFINVKTGEAEISEGNFDNNPKGLYQIYDVELIEEIPESEKMKTIISDEEILAKANNFYKKPRPGYIDLDMNDRGEL